MRFRSGHSPQIRDARSRPSKRRLEARTPGNQPAVLRYSQGASEPIGRNARDTPRLLGGAPTGGAITPSWWRVSGASRLGAVAPEEGFRLPTDRLTLVDCLGGPAVHRRQFLCRSRSRKPRGYLRNREPPFWATAPPLGRSEVNRESAVSYPVWRGSWNRR